MSATQRKADYGLDAPGVVRNLLIVAGVGAVIFACRLLGFWQGNSKLGLLFYPLMGTGAGCLPMGLWMIWDSRVAKVRARERIFDALKLSGNEQVLDIGCGRGLWLIGAAKRLKAGGKAVGIDIWNAEDLSNNAAGQTMENVRIEGVADRVKVLTADARRLPFDNASFDLIVSCMVLHNIYESRERDVALAEIARVLKPGGRTVIVDMRNIPQYSRALCDNGIEARIERTWVSYIVAAWTFGSVQLGRVEGRKLAGVSAPTAVIGA